MPYAGRNQGSQNAVSSFFAFPPSGHQANELLVLILVANSPTVSVTLPADWVLEKTYTYPSSHKLFVFAYEGNNTISSISVNMSETVDAAWWCLRFGDTDNFGQASTGNQNFSQTTDPGTLPSVVGDYTWVCLAGWTQFGSVSSFPSDYSSDTNQLTLGGAKGAIAVSTLLSSPPTNNSFQLTNPTDWSSLAFYISSNLDYYLLDGNLILSLKGITTTEEMEPGNLVLNQYNLLNNPTIELEAGSLLLNLQPILYGEEEQLEAGQLVLVPQNTDVFESLDYGNLELSLKSFEDNLLPQLGLKLNGSNLFFGEKTNLDSGQLELTHSSLQLGVGYPLQSGELVFVGYSLSEPDYYLDKGQLTLLPRTFFGAVEIALGINKIDASSSPEQVTLLLPEEAFEGDYCGIVLITEPSGTVEIASAKFDFFFTPPTLTIEGEYVLFRLIDNRWLKVAYTNS
ncbi:MAG: hypothetical protein KatS3mg087_1358 [Patescibacteria group bacterium]|nr:MAG: hypothetical protein KatS3mg087_1358 [Patescibacteria group bacterium]